MEGESTAGEGREASFRCGVQGIKGTDGRMRPELCVLATQGCRGAGGRQVGGTQPTPVGPGSRLPWLSTPSSGFQDKAAS